MYSHYTDPSCTPQSFLNNDTEGLLSCTAGNLGSDMMVFGPAGITMTTFSNAKCTGAPTKTRHYLSFACWNTPEGGSEMVSLHHHHRFSQTECKGQETKTNVTMYQPDGTVDNSNCVSGAGAGTTISSRYVIGPPGYF